MNREESPEFLAVMEVNEVIRRWNWWRHTDAANAPVPQFVMDEYERRYRALMKLDKTIEHDPA